MQRGFWRWEAILDVPASAKLPAEHSLHEHLQLSHTEWGNHPTDRSQSLKRFTEDQGSIHLSCGSHNLWRWPKKTRTAYFSPDIWGLCWPHMLYISSGLLATCQLEGFSRCFRISEGLVTGKVSEMPWWHLLFQLGVFTFLFFFF